MKVLNPALTAVQRSFLLGHFAYLIVQWTGGVSAAPPLHVDAPTGSDFLRGLVIQAPPFGVLQQETYPYEGVRIQRWRRNQPEVDWLVTWIDLRTPGLGYRLTPIYDAVGPSGGPWRSCRAQTTRDFVRQHNDVSLEPVMHLKPGTGRPTA
jgi:hypothetical protein